MEKLEALKKYFGHDEFRSGQEEMIDSILNSRDALGIMPTGAGKSICYQLPSLLMDGVTIIISPLISLMKDQVSALRQVGISTAFVNSSQSAWENSEVLKSVENGEIKLIYVTPERLETSEFLNLSQKINISMITVDEAHCISQWGQDFRPSYLKILEFIKLLPKRPVVSAFTATATKDVREDIAESLELHNPTIITTGFDRENLSFAVERPADKYKALLDILIWYKDKNAIVYCSTRKNVEDVAQRLTDDGYNATYYHGGLSDKTRQTNQDDFIFDRKNIMVATNAFGMGIDKSNVSLVVHYNMPKDIESYYQEAGRAGRDGEPAECVLLYGGQDVRTNRFLIENSRESKSDIPEELREIILERDLERLKKMTFYSTTQYCLRKYILNYFGETAPNNCGNCSRCNANHEKVDITIDSQKIVSCVYRLEQKKLSLQENAIIDILLGKTNDEFEGKDLTSLSTFGIMKDCTHQKIEQILSFLLRNNYLTNSGDGVALTSRSNTIIRDKKSLFMIIECTTEKSTSSTTKSISEDINAELFAELKVLRASLAKVVSVPAYIIFTDSSLRDMCAKLPTNKADFLSVEGVGEVKAKRYGDDFMKIIGKYKTK